MRKRLVKVAHSDAKLFVLLRCMNTRAIHVLYPCCALKRKPSEVAHWLLSHNTLWSLSTVSHRSLARCTCRSEPPFYRSWQSWQNVKISHCISWVSSGISFAVWKLGSFPARTHQKFRQHCVNSYVPGQRSSPRSNYMHVPSDQDQGVSSERFK